VEIVVLDRLGDRTQGQFSTPLSESALQAPQFVDLVGLQWQVSCEEVVVVSRQGGQAQVGDAVGQVFSDVRGLSALQFGVRRKEAQPQLGWIAQRADRCAGIAHVPPGRDTRNTVAHGRT